MNDDFNPAFDVDDSRLDVEFEAFGAWLVAACVDGPHAALADRHGPAHLRVFLELLVAQFDDSWFSQTAVAAAMAGPAGRLANGFFPALGTGVARLLAGVQGIEVDGAVLVRSVVHEEQWRVARVEEAALSPYTGHLH